MEQLFLKLFNMSINAGWIVLAVIVFRFLFKKTPKWINVCMWGIVGLRLILPFSLESIFSLIPSAETVPEDIMYSAEPTVQTGISVINSAVNPVISESLAPNMGDSANPMQIVVFAAAFVWIIGMCVMALYAGVSYLYIKIKVRASVKQSGNVMLCDSIDTPFILGIIKPKIYLPSGISKDDAKYVLAHERAHLKRGDHFIKPIGFLLLCVYWFNPVLWAAYIFLCRDVELACDEKVLKSMGEEIKKPYSETLVNCSVKRKALTACPLAFGETGVGTRIKSILKYKKPALIIVIISLVLCAVFAVCFLTNPKTSVNDKLSVFIDCTLADKYQTKDTEGIASCLDWQVIGTKNRGGKKTLYMWVLYEEFSFDGTDLHEESGAHTFTSLTVKKEDGQYKLVDYKVPRDGSYYDDDIKEMVPFYLYAKALDSQRYYKNQHENCIGLALDYFGISKSFAGGIEGPSNIITTKKLTLEELISLSEKGEELTWTDFEGYTHYDVGSGLYVERFPIDDMFYLLIGGSYNIESEEMEPIYFYLRSNDGTEASIDIRDGDVKKFIADHKDNAIVGNLTTYWNLCPVGPCESAYSELIEHYGIPKNAALNHILSLNTVKITSVSELEAFCETVNGHMDLSLSYPDKDALTTPSFDSIKDQYTNDFFKKSALFIIYISSGAPERYTIDKVTLTEGKLSICIEENLYASEDTKQEGWLMCVSLSNDDLSGMTEYGAYITKRNDRDSTLEVQPVSSYVYTASDEVIKPGFHLYKEGTFQATFSALDSTLYDGTYLVTGDKLILATHDGSSIFTFKIEGDTVVFDKEHSSDIFFKTVPDGAVFELALPYEPQIKDE